MSVEKGDHSLALVAEDFTAKLPPILPRSKPLSFEVPSPWAGGIQWPQTDQQVVEYDNASRK